MILILYGEGNFVDPRASGGDGDISNHTDGYFAWFDGNPLISFPKVYYNLDIDRKDCNICSKRRL